MQAASKIDQHSQPDLLQLLDLKLADKPWSRMKGLLGQTGLTDNQGLWITPCNSVHSLFMKFSLDLIWLDKNQQILRIDRNFKPWRFATCLKARSVIEVAAGTVDSIGILHDQYSKG